MSANGKIQNGPRKLCVQYYVCVNKTNALPFLKQEFLPSNSNISLEVYYQINSSPMVSLTLFLLPCLAAGSWAFQVPSTFTIASRSSVATRAKTYDHSDVDNVNAPTTAATELMPRRTVIATTISSLLATAAVIPAAVAAEDTTFLQTYDDFTATSEGWSYTDKKIGTDIGGGDLKDGDRVVFDWSGYTIGYFGRPFEAKG